MKRFWFLLMATLVLFVAGCKSEEIDYECYSTPQPPPGIEPILSTPGLNLSLLEENVDYKQNDVIIIKIENLTDEKIWLAKDYSIRISEVIEPYKEFRRIDDLFIHDLEENIILEPNGEIDSATAFFVQPDILVEGESKQVYVFIWGTAVRDGKYCTDKYGGGLIVTINP